MSIRLILIIALMFLAGACQNRDKNPVFDGPLKEHKNNPIWKFDQYPAMKTGGSDALRIIVQPSFGMYNYRFDIKPQKGGCQIFNSETDDWDTHDPQCLVIWVDGERWTTTEGRHLNGLPRKTSFRFYVPEEEFRDLFDAVHDRLHSWEGNGRTVVDGTSIAIEQHRRGAIQSYKSNARLSDASDPAVIAGLAVHRMALAYGPDGLFPVSADWHVFEPTEDPYYRPCGHTGLRTPDPDGFGTGDDACAKFLKEHY